MYINLSSLLIGHKSQIFLFFSCRGQKRDTEAEREAVDTLIKVPTAFLCCFLRRISRRTTEGETGKVPAANWSCQTSIPPRLHTSCSPDQGKASSIMQQAKNKAEDSISGADVPSANGTVAAAFQARKRPATSAAWSRRRTSGHNGWTERVDVWVAKGPL